MSTIFRTNAGRLTVADAKRLISEALPPEPGYEVWEASDGAVEIRPVQDGGYSHGRIDATFLAACASESIVPRYLYEPTRTGYEGTGYQDVLFTVTHDELARFAKLYGLSVQVCAEPAAPVPNAAVLVPGVVTAEKTVKATQAARKMAREDGRLRECEAKGITFDRASLLRLPDGIGAVATDLNIARQSLSTDLKAALKRRFETAKNGKG